MLTTRVKCFCGVSNLEGIVGWLRSGREEGRGRFRGRCKRASCNDGQEQTRRSILVDIESVKRDGERVRLESQAPTGSGREVRLGGVGTS